MQILGTSGFPLGGPCKKMKAPRGIPAVPLPGMVPLYPWILSLSMPAAGLGKDLWDETMGKREGSPKLADIDKMKDIIIKLAKIIDREKLE